MAMQFGVHLDPDILALMMSEPICLQPSFSIGGNGRIRLSAQKPAEEEYEDGNGGGGGGGGNGDLKVVSDRFWKERRVDPHEIKQDFLGKKAEIKRFDLAKDNRDGIWIIRKSRRDGQFPPIFVDTLERVLMIYGH
jgi:hypothetical protein